MLEIGPTGKHNKKKPLVIDPKNRNREKKHKQNKKN